MKGLFFCLLTLLATLFAGCGDNKEIVQGVVQIERNGANAGTGLWLVSGSGTSAVQDLRSFMQEHNNRRRLYGHHFDEFHSLIRSMESQSPLMRSVPLDSQFRFATDITSLPKNQKQDLFVYFYIFIEKPLENGRLVQAWCWIQEAQPDLNVVLNPDSAYLLHFEILN